MQYDYELWFDLGFIEGAWCDASPREPEGAMVLERMAFRHGYFLACQAW